MSTSKYCFSRPRILSCPSSFQLSILTDGQEHPHRSKIGSIGAETDNFVGAFAPSIGRSPVCKEKLNAIRVNGVACLGTMSAKIYWEHLLPSDSMAMWAKFREAENKNLPSLTALAVDGLSSGEDLPCGTSLLAEANDSWSGIPKKQHHPAT